MTKIVHGANIFEISREYGFKTEDIKDFSSNINPLGPSKKALDVIITHLDLITAYPDTEYIQLKNAISNHTGALNDHILLGSGTTSLISAFIHWVKPERAMIIAPSYSEYERELLRVQSKIYSYFLKRDANFVMNIEDFIRTIQAKKPQLVILTNPNNPTGTAITKEDLAELIRQTDCYYLIDETYIEFTDVEKFSAIELADQMDRLLVLRSTSKFFASPGIRLGYGISYDPKILDSLNGNQELWNINIFADIMGVAMFEDQHYQNKTFNFIQKEKREVCKHLNEIKDIRVFPSESNFILCQILNEKTATELRNYLLPFGMVIRDCQSFQGLDASYFRFCLLEHDSNQKLLQQIAKFFI